jgi:hypothetical protein
MAPEPSDRNREKRIAEAVALWTNDHDPAARGELIVLAVARFCPEAQGDGPRSPAAERTLRGIEEAVDYFLKSNSKKDVAARFERHIERSVRLIPLQDAIDRWRDAATEPEQVAARKDLIGLSVGELRAIAGNLIGALATPAPIGVTELVQEIVVRLLERLEAEKTESPQQYLSYAGKCIRFFLGDLVKRKVLPTVSLDQTADIGDGGFAWDSSTTTFDPAKLAILTEIHEHLARAPELEQRVFE